MKGLECRLLTPEFEDSLGEFFELCQLNGDDRFFYPHPLTRIEARRLVHYDGEDMYYVLLLGKKVVAYGMVRGWDEGYEIPTSGRLIHPDFRGKGLGSLLIRFLYMSAFLGGAKKMLAHVEPSNTASLIHNAQMGHDTEMIKNGVVTSICDLGPRSFTQRFDDLIREAVIRFFPKRVELNCEIISDEEFIASETIGEVIEKLIILNIRIWYLVGKALGIEDKDEYLENHKRISHCYKFKRPRLIVCLNRMLKALARGQLNLVEDFDVKDY